MFLYFFVVVFWGLLFVGLIWDDVYIVICSC